MIGPIAARVILAVFSTLFILLHVWPISSPPPHDVIILVATPPGPALITTPSPGPVWLRANTAPLAEKAFTTPAPIAEAATTAPLAELIKATDATKAFTTPAPIAEAATTAPLAELIKATGAAEAFTTPAPVAEAAVEASSADLAATRSTTPIFIYDTSEETTTTSERSPVQARMLASVAVALRGQEAQWTLHRLSSRTALRAALSDLDAADALLFARADAMDELVEAGLLDDVSDRCAESSVLLLAGDAGDNAIAAGSEQTRELESAQIVLGALDALSTAALEGADAATDASGAKTTLAFLPSSSLALVRPSAQTHVRGGELRAEEVLLHAATAHDLSTRLPLLLGIDDHFRLHSALTASAWSEVPAILKTRITNHRPTLLLEDANPEEWNVLLQTISVLLDLSVPTEPQKQLVLYDALALGTPVVGVQRVSAGRPSPLTSSCLYSALLPTQLNRDAVNAALRAAILSGRRHRRAATKLYDCVLPSGLRPAAFETRLAHVISRALKRRRAVCDLGHHHISPPDLTAESLSHLFAEHGIYEGESDAHRWGAHRFFAAHHRGPRPDIALRAALWEHYSIRP